MLISFHPSSVPYLFFIYIVVLSLVSRITWGHLENTSASAPPVKILIRLRIGPENWYLKK